MIIGVSSAMKKLDELQEFITNLIDDYDTQIKYKDELIAVQDKEIERLHKLLEEKEEEANDM